MGPLLQGRESGGADVRFLRHESSARLRSLRSSSDQQTNVTRSTCSVLPRGIRGRLRTRESRWSRRHEERDHKRFNLNPPYAVTNACHQKHVLRTRGQVRHKWRIQESPARRRHEEQVSKC